MNITVVVGNSIMFRYLAVELQNKLKEFNVQVIVEDTYKKENFKKQIKFRIKKYGLLKFIDEVVYRFYETFIQRANNIYNQYFPSKEELKINFISQCINDIETHLQIKNFQPDVLLIFGTSIVKNNILDVPRVATLNIHPGINPKYKGAGSFWAMKNQDFKNYGFTIHEVDDGIDTGDIVLSKRVNFQKKHLIIPHMYSQFTLEATEDLINILRKLKKDNMLSKQNPITKEDGYYTWFGMTDYIVMRWKNRNA